ncbi:uncharacterized protein LOC144178380 isoform X1 [Haemaphysalis longicornis]
MALTRNTHHDRSPKAFLLASCILFSILWHATDGQYPPGEPACRSWYQECGIQRSYPCCGSLTCWHGRCIFRKEDRQGYAYPKDNVFPPPWYYQRFQPVYPVNFRP